MIFLRYSESKPPSRTKTTTGWPRRTNLIRALQPACASLRTGSKGARGILLLVLGTLWAGSAPQLPVQAEQGKRSNIFPHDCDPTRIRDNDIPNFHRVDRDLYRGARPAYRKDVYLKLVDLGIKTIINLETGDASKEEPVARGRNLSSTKCALPRPVSLRCREIRRYSTWLPSERCKT